MPTSVINVNVDEPNRKDFPVAPDQRQIFVFVGACFESRKQQRE
jgi:hypothetical protein